MPIKNVFVPLITAIDDQNLNKVREFIIQNPNLDYNHVLPNGLSLLWVVLFPPQGKTVSEDLLKFTLTYVKHNGVKLVNPLQKHLGLFADDLILDPKLNKLITDAQNDFTENDEAHLLNAEGLAGIAADGQNTHNPLVVRLCDENTKRLFVKYAESEVPSDKTIHKTEVEIRDSIDHLGIKQFNTHELTLIRDSLSRCLTLTGTRTYQPLEGEPFKLTIAQVLVLVWRAAKEMDTNKLTPLLVDPQDLDQTSQCNDKQVTDNRILAVFQALLSAHTAYRLGNPACEMGTRNQLAMALAAMNPCVHGGLNTEVKLSGELARYFMSAALGRKLEQLADNDLSKYWLILRNTLALDEVNETAAEEAYQEYIETLRVGYKSVFLSQVVEGDIDQFLSALTDSFPLFGHGLSSNLGQLISLLKDLKEPIDGYYRLPPREAYQMALDATSAQLVQNELWGDYVKRHGLSNDTAFAQKLIHIWQTLAPTSDQVTPPLAILWTKECDEGWQTYRQRCLLLTAWAVQKEEFIGEFPLQADWINQLTATQIHILLALLIEQKGPAVLGELRRYFPLLINFALEEKFTNKLSLRGVVFKDKNLRGVDFRGADLRGAVFKRCDWRGAEYDAKTQFADAKFDQCIMRDWTTDYYSLKQQNLIRKLTYEGLTAHFLVLLQHSELGKKILGQLDDNYKICVFATAARQGHFELVRALMDHPLFDTECIMIKTDPYGTDTTALGGAAFDNHADIVKFIINHPKFTLACFEQTHGSEEQTALISAASNGSTQSVIAIMAHPLFTLTDFMRKDTYGRTALMKAAERGHVETVKAIISHPYFPLNSVFYRSKTMLPFSLFHSYLLPNLKALINTNKILILMQKLNNYAGNNSSHLSHFSHRYHHVPFVKKLLGMTDLTLETLYQEISDYKAQLHAENREIRPRGKLASILRVVPELLEKGPVLESKISRMGMSF